MKAFVFSIGEKTTDLCQWSLKRLGFKPVLLYDPKTTFNQKYEEFLERAQGEKWVMKVDADLIVLRKFKSLLKEAMEANTNGEIWWFNTRCFDFLNYTMSHSGPKVMNNRVIEIGQKYKKDFFVKHLKPETAFWNRDEFKNPRRCKIIEGLSALHAYKQDPQYYERVLKVKKQRKQWQKYDHELIDKINEL